MKLSIWLTLEAYSRKSPTCACKARVLVGFRGKDGRVCGAIWSDQRTPEEAADEVMETCAPDEFPGGRDNIRQIAITGFADMEQKMLFVVSLEREGDRWRRVEQLGKVPDPPHVSVI